MRDAALLVDVLLALGTVTYIEQALVEIDRRRRDQTTIYGALDGRRLYVNPLHHKRKADVVSTLLHEGIHACRPTWSEAGVKAAETRLIRRLSDEEIEAIYRNYKRAAKRLKGEREV